MSDKIQKGLLISRGCNMKIVNFSMFLCKNYNYLALRVDIKALLNHHLKMSLIQENYNINAINNFCQSVIDMALKLNCIITKERKIFQKE